MAFPVSLRRFGSRCGVDSHFQLALCGAGAGAPTVRQQVSKCVRQMDCLLAGMRTGVRSTHHLTLRMAHKEEGLIQHSNPGASPVQAVAVEQQLQPSLLQAPFPASYGVVPGSVFGVLAAALPNLLELTLHGCCWDAVLPVFGTSCPKLRGLCVDANTVPSSVLGNMGIHLPRLECLTVTSANADPAQELQLGEYVDAVCFALQHSLTFSDLRLNFFYDLTLRCQTSSWILLPDSLKHMTCNCKLQPSGPLTNVFRGLTHLSVAHSPCPDLVQVMKDFPLLRCLEVSEFSEDNEPLHIACADRAGMYGVALLKERLLHGSFTLVSSEIIFSGTCRELQSLFAWFPKDVGSSGCSIEDDFQGGLQEDFLESLTCMFPGMASLTLLGTLAASTIPEMNLRFFQPLRRSRILGLDLLCPQFNLSTAGLTQLCSSLAGLEDPIYQPCEAVDIQSLDLELKKLGLVITLSEETE